MNLFSIKLPLIRNNDPLLEIIIKEIEKIDEEKLFKEFEEICKKHSFDDIDLNNLILTFKRDGCWYPTEGKGAIEALKILLKKVIKLKKALCLVLTY